MAQQFGRMINPVRSIKPVHIVFGCMDHYEPDWGKADEALQVKRVERWLAEYPRLANKHKDADGKIPRHTFFYPAEVYNKKCLDLLSQLCHNGYGEVEIHLHIDNETEEGFAKHLEKAKALYSAHGLLGKRKLSGQIRFGFIHGNWALNNSRKDGRWCGVNDQSNILIDAGCYADFTYPSAPDETQPKKINSIYYGRSFKNKPKGHNKGVDARLERFQDEGLLMVQGPLTFNWKNRKKGIIPSIENGDITGNNFPTKERIDLWVDQHICVKGRENWIFIKVHTHGAPEKNAGAVLGEPMDNMFHYLESKYNDGKNFVLHYATAREMVNIIKAAEAGEKGEPGDYRDYIVEKNW
jgi:hypothetical protein